LTKLVQGLLWNQKVGRERIRLMFFPSGFFVEGAIRSFDEDVTFAVLEDVGRFVKEGEPEEVICFASQAELQDCF
jgi:hypothetical protein